MRLLIVKLVKFYNKFLHSFYIYQSCFQLGRFGKIVLNLYSSGSILIQFLQAATLLNAQNVFLGAIKL